MERAHYRQFQKDLYELKLRYWKHPDSVIIHATDIKRRKYAFKVFEGKPSEYDQFLKDICTLISASEFFTLNAAIDKTALQQPGAYTFHNVYETCFQFILERCVYNLQRHPDIRLTVFAESRNDAEDRQLDRFFKSMKDLNSSQYVNSASFRKIQPHLIFQRKTANVSGLQLSDLCAMSTRRSLEYADYKGRDFEVVKPKIKASSNGVIKGWGMKIHP